MVKNMLPSESHFRELTVLCKALQDLVSLLPLLHSPPGLFAVPEHISLTLGFGFFFLPETLLSQWHPWSSSASKTSFLITLLCIVAQFDPFSEPSSLIPVIK